MFLLALIGIPIAGASLSRLSWWTLAFATVLVVLVALGEGAYGAWRELREQVDEAERTATNDQAVLGEAARLLSTELQNIRSKIELVRSARPHPHYSHGFRLPGARWDDYDDLLARDHPDLFGDVEAAYVAADAVNEHLAMRETRANPGQTLAEIDEDGLDRAYETAGQALEALAPIIRASGEG